MANLWRGVGPNVARNAIINAAELASYDQAGLMANTSILPKLEGAHATPMRAGSSC